VGEVAGGVLQDTSDNDNSTKLMAIRGGAYLR